MKVYTLREVASMLHYPDNSAGYFRARRYVLKRERDLGHSVYRQAGARSPWLFDEDKLLSDFPEIRIRVDVTLEDVLVSANLLRKSTEEELSNLNEKIECLRSTMYSLEADMDYLRAVALRN